MATTVFSVSQETFDAVANASNEWGEMFEHAETMRVVDMHSFHGGIDHIDVHSKKIVFHDRGCNGRGRDLVIVRDTEISSASHPILLKK